SALKIIHVGAFIYRDQILSKFIQIYIQNASEIKEKANSGTVHAARDGKRPTAHFRAAAPPRLGPQPSSRRPGRGIGPAWRAASALLGLIWPSLPARDPGCRI